MRFDEIRGRLTGISCPIFGVSWNPPEPERNRARRVIVFLEDRRVLYNPSEMEVPHHCVESVLAIREHLTHELEDMEPTQTLAAHLMALRSACRTFLDRLGPRAPEIIRFAAHVGHFASWTFGSALGQLRGEFGIHLAQIAAEYGLDVEDDLASIFPGPPDRGTDDAPASRARRR
jgi:hypothetical protein